MSVSSITETSAVVSGVITFNGGTSITSYGVFLNNENRKIPSSTSNEDLVFTVTIPNLTPGTDYSVKTYAVNLIGTGYSPDLNFTTLSSIVLPIVQTKEATNVECTAVTLNGLINGTEIPDGYEFTFEYGLDDSYGNEVPAEVTVSSSDGITAKAEISNLEIGSRYKYRFKADNNQGDVVYGTVMEFTTAEPSLIIPGTNIMDVATDVNGNIYAVGAFNGVNRKTDAFVAKFDAEYKFVWRKNIVTEDYDWPRGGVLVFNNTVYVHVGRNDESGTGGADLFVDAYNCDTGEMEWSTKVGEGLGDDMEISKDGFIYSVTNSALTKISPNGNIEAQFLAPGGTGLGTISIYDENNIFVGGSRIVPVGLASVILRLDKNLNITWEGLGTVSSLVGIIADAVSFKNSSLLFVTESVGDPLSGVAMETFVTCYSVKADGLEFKWRKPFDGTYNIGLKKNNDDFYVYSRDFQSSGWAYGLDPKGPILMSQEGETLWTADTATAIRGNIAFTSDKIFVAHDVSSLTVISK